MQTPTARMESTGAVRLHISNVEPYTRGNVMLQPLDWLEAGFRYSSISNRLYGPSIAGNQAYKDKSIDVKIRLREESDTWPQLALGVRDLGGTGLFSGEYLVAGKRWGNWDASLGLGWGYLGARGNVRNPLSLLGARFDTRPGAVYRYSPFIDFSIGLERGNRLMLGLTFHGGLDALYSPKLLDPALPAARPQEPAPMSPAGIGATAQTLELFTGWAVRSPCARLHWRPTATGIQWSGAASAPGSARNWPRVMARPSVAPTGFCSTRSACRPNWSIVLLTAPGSPAISTCVCSTTTTSSITRHPATFRVCVRCSASSSPRHA
jgi:hypothetical protein